MESNSVSETADDFCRRGMELGAQARFQEAIAAFNQALAINPDHTKTLMVRATLYLRQRQPAAAIADFERLADISRRAANEAGAHMWEQRIHSTQAEFFPKNCE